eukprot:647758-Lingulodinium_polyedra.AAC.1
MLYGQLDAGFPRPVATGMLYRQLYGQLNVQPWIFLNLSLDPAECPALDPSQCPALDPSQCPALDLSQ